VSSRSARMGVGDLECAYWCVLVSLILFLFRLIGHRGLRRGESCGLAWNDVDLDAPPADPAAGLGHLRGHAEVRRERPGGRSRRQHGRCASRTPTAPIRVSPAVGAGMGRLGQGVHPRERLSAASGDGHRPGSRRLPPPRSYPRSDCTISGTGMHRSCWRPGRP
jgi:hypothetical protein